MFTSINYEALNPSPLQRLFSMADMQSYLLWLEAGPGHSLWLYFLLTQQSPLCEKGKFFQLKTQYMRIHVERRVC